jgi:hypothetical protein
MCGLKIAGPIQSMLLPTIGETLALGVNTKQSSTSSKVMTLSIG